MWKWFLFLMCFVLSNCAREQENKFYINPVLEDEKFLDEVSKLNITILAPASGVSSSELSRLKITLGQHVRFVDDKHYIKKISLKTTSLTKVLLSDTFECIEKHFRLGGIFWSAKGGYGSSLLINELNKRFEEGKIKSKGVLIGYSDITSLHLFMSQKMGWICIHAPNANELIKPNKNPGSFSRLIEVLSGKCNKITINIQPINNLAKNTSSIEGKLTGGNLTLIETSIATIWQVDCKEKIVFIEDVNCQCYQIFRSLKHLQDSGVLDKAKAIVFGNFSIKPNDKLMGFLSVFSNDIGIPVFLTDRFGHEEHNDPIGYNIDGVISKNVDDGTYKLEVNFKDTFVKKSD